MKLKKNFTYIDLFAGIGGFHYAMDAISNNKAKCIYASEIDEFARKVYKDNFNIEPLGDIHKINPSKYPAPDVVCGGFPCQTFSKAGKRNGFKDPRGTLFREIVRIIEFYKFSERPKILLLENVRNLISHDNGETWKTIKHELMRIGYNVINSPVVASPNDFGVPQLRDRAIILCVRKDLYTDEIKVELVKKDRNKLSINSVLETSKCNLKGSRKINDEQKYALDCWDDFINHVDRQIIGFPIWFDYFKYSGKTSGMKDWKIDFINKNKALYSRNKKFIDEWAKRWDVTNKLTPTNRKFEWQVNGKIKTVYDGIIQFRTSGIRVKQYTESPALVAMVHLPILGKKARSISVREAANLQSFPSNCVFNETDQLAFKQLGNAVNVKVITEVFRRFLKNINCKLGD